MKTKITPLTLCALLLLTACGQVESNPVEMIPPTPAIQGEPRILQTKGQSEPITVVEEPDVTRSMEQEQLQTVEVPQMEAMPQITSEPTQSEKPVPTEDIPSVIVHAKTGYYEDTEPAPDPEPTPTEPADRQAAIDTANAYAVSQYGVTTDGSLTLENSAYRFPAVVPVDASQATLEAKARDMVDFTFRQLMLQANVDSLADAGVRCNVCIIEDGGSLLIYVLYDG